MKGCYGFIWIILIFFINSGAVTAQIISKPGKECPSSALVADVVAIDHPMVFNRLGAQNVNWMMYALRHDLVDISDPKNLKTLDYTREGERLFKKAKLNHKSRNIALRPDLRPRPLVLRVAAGDYLKVNFTNLLHVKPGPHPKPDDPFSNQANPFDSYPDPLPNIDHPMEHARKDRLGTLDENKIYRSDDQVASRMAGFHPQGLELVASINSDSSFVGKNKNSMAAPGETQTYCFYAPEEGAFLVSSDGAVFGGEGTAGNSGVGLFGAVTVQPKGARFYRAQVNEEEMRLATTGETPNGQPIVDYEALYPNDRASNGIWHREGKAGKPVLNMVQNKRILHGDINALIIGPNDDGSFDCATYPLEGKNEAACKDLTKLKKLPKKDQRILDEISKLEAQIERNPTLPNRLEPFREFVSIFHDENAATQAFPYFFEHPELRHTLHGVRDSFMINYGSGGVGAEIIANRLQAGPMQDCLDCAYEEFFLSSFAVGDAAMLVDNPANLVISQCQPEFIAMIKDPADPAGKNEILDPKYKNERDKFCLIPKKDRVTATEAYYPHDPANVHHSYIGDFVKFRNLHSGKEQHIFHLHNHQWLFNPNDDNSNYIDAQGIGPGSGYTYEIAYGGSGNRNKTVGDAIFHCHYYPHFAQGMWYMWRNHDVFEAGTKLAISETETGFHKELFGLKHGKPAAQKARALPDGEIVAGTPIPAIVPLPGKGMALKPGEVIVQPRIGLDGETYGSVAKVMDRNKNPGFPFWVAGVETTVGSRPTTPPLDMSSIPGVVSGWDGGLPRHALAGFSAGGEAHSKINRFTAEKHLLKARPVYYDEAGTDLERLAMQFHAKPRPGHATHKVDMTGAVSASHFVTNGAPAIPGAPFNEPCIDDEGERLRTGGNGRFFGGTYGKNGYIDVDPKLLPDGIEFGHDNPRVYKGANLQLDVVFNKIGYHYPQQRILTLWEDVGPLLDKTRSPEPLVMRLNTFDCAMYAHTNLVPKDFYADDYQITTPTDVIGQHIHLPKWDLTSADGGANGWNYEDGTFSPGMVRERIYAINKWNQDNLAIAVPKPDGSNTPLAPLIHPYFNANEIPNHQAANCTEQWEAHVRGGEGNLHEFEVKYGMPGACDWLGARTTLQRWFSDPLVNRGGIHRGLGITFTHDHLGPSTHQQLGLYATMLTEPPGSEWRHNETGEKFYTRDDGGPTSWQAAITGKDGKCIDVDHDSGGDCTKKGDDSHREFFLQFGDFQHAYVKGAYYGVNEDGVGWPLHPAEDGKPDENSFRKAINPSVRKPANPVLPDIIAFESYCPGGGEAERLPGAVYNAISRPPRPCPEAISADDIGMMVVNYRNEPIGARVYDENLIAWDNKKGAQAEGFAGDLAFALQTRTDRAISVLNGIGGEDPSLPGSRPHYQEDVNKHRLLGDPYTPIMRAYSGDLIRVKVQGGAHEHEHNGSINALSWMQGGSGFGQAPHSGWRNSQNTGLSEQFTFTANITDYSSDTHLNDRMYTVDTSQDGMWNGVWGILRSKNVWEDDDVLVRLPSNPIPTVLAPELRPEESKVTLGTDNLCPADAKVREYHVAAVLANKVLENSLNVTIPGKLSQNAPIGSSKLDPEGGSLIYNPRATTISIEMEDERKGKRIKKVFGTGPLHDPTAIMFVRLQDLDRNNKLKDNKPVEPLVLRAAAGDCIKVVLHNHLPKGRKNMPDLDGYTSVSGIIHRGADVDGSVTTFNNNLIRPSNRIGLHPQLVHYNAQTSDGNNVGVNRVSTAAPGEQIIYQWYAGVVDTSSAQACLTDDEDVERKYNLLNRFAELSRLKEGKPTRSPVRPLTSDAFKEIVRSTLKPGYIDVGELSGDEDIRINKIVERLKKVVSSSNLSRAFPILDEQVEIESESDAIRNKGLGSINTETLSRLIAVLRSPENQLIEKTDQVPLRDKERYFDLFKIIQEGHSPEFIERFDPVSLIKELENGFAEVLRSESDVIKPLYRFIRKLNEERQLTVFWKEKLGKEFFSVDTGENIGKLSDISALFLAKSLFYEVIEQDPEAFKWRAEFYKKGKFNLKLSEKNVRLVKLGEVCRHVPVEFGAINLSPPDRIKQGQKAAVGALIIEPEKSVWIENLDDQAIDRQNPGANQSNKRATRATATVFYPAGERRPPFNSNWRFFRDLVMVHQKGLNLRYADGSAVANLAAEKEEANENSQQTAPEDAHDSGHMAINYGAEPMWFRYGLPPDAPFGKEGFGGAASAWQAFSNDCCSNRTVGPAGTGGTVISADVKKVGEPYVPVMTAYAGQEMRIRALMPTGVGRASTMELHGHSWPRDPYLAERVFVSSSGSFPIGSRPVDWGVPAKCIGENAMAMHLGGQESVSPMAHFDMVFPRAGGTHGVKGDYLWRDHTGFGITNGLWALIRVESLPSLIPLAPDALRANCKPG